jgi:hypothetical protein
MVRALGVSSKLDVQIERRCSTPLQPKGCCLIQLVFNRLPLGFRRQGWGLTEMMLRGSLENFGLVLIALLTAELKTTSWLRLTGGPVSADLALQDGHLVWAAFGNQRGLPALDAVALGLADAAFELEQGAAPREPNLSLTVAELRAHLLSLGASLADASATGITPKLRAGPTVPQAAWPAIRRISAGDGRLTAVMARLARTRKLIGMAMLVALGATAALIIPPISNRLADLKAGGTPAPQLAFAPLSDSPAELSVKNQPVPDQPATSEQLPMDLRFASQAPGWPIKPPFVTWSDGAYRLAAKASAQFVAIEAPVQPITENVMINATFHKTGGPPGGGYGIIVRHQNGEPLEGSFQGGHYYVLEAADGGEVGVWRRDDDHWVDLLPWTHSDAVQTGAASNQLGVQTFGNTLVFLVNGIEVTRQTDTTLPRGGGVGIFVGGDGNEVALDRFSLGRAN